MGFFKPAWMTDNESKAQRAITARGRRKAMSLAELDADEELARIARSDGDTYSYSAKCKGSPLWT